jgi:hypothetical protein
MLLLRHSSEVIRDETAVLGVQARVPEILEQLSLGEIDRLLERSFEEVRPRWEDRPHLWQQLIRAATTTDLRVKRDADLEGLQLLASRLI